MANAGTDKMLEQPSFGRRLKSMRVERRLSQAAVAGEGMSTGYLSRLESGIRPPTAHAVAYLAERLGVSAAEFEEPTSGSLAQLLAAATSSGTGDTAEALVSAVAVEGEANPVLHWQALWLLARLENRRGRRTEELGHLQELLTVSDEIGLLELRVRARTQLARCKRALGNIDSAVGVATSAVSMAREGKLDVQDMGAALLTLASVEAEAGRLPDARAHVEEACALVPASSENLRVDALWSAATVRVRQGDCESAQAPLVEALELLDSRTDLMLRMAAVSLYLQTAPPRVDAARTYISEAEAALGLIGGPLQQQELLTLSARLAFHEGRIAEARALCDRLNREELRLTFRDEVRFDILRNQLLILDGQVEEGISNLRSLAQQARGGLNVDLEAEIWRILAETLANSPNRTA
jgi:transcriptional regulator with XRE-family HTH domain